MKRLRCARFPDPGDERLRKGVSRNFKVFDALEFLAEVTQHIPDKGRHLIYSFGGYSNRERGMRKKGEAVAGWHMVLKICLFFNLDLANMQE